MNIFFNLNFKLQICIIQVFFKYYFISISILYFFFPKRTSCNSGNIYQKWPIIDPDGHSQEKLTGNSAAAVRVIGPRGI